MIGRMERRFTLVAVLVISLVLLVLLTAVNIITIQSNINKVDGSLERFASGSINTDRMDPKDGEFKPPEDFEINGELTPPEGFESNDDARFKIDREENRFFLVTVDSDLNLLGSNAVEQNMMDEASAYALSLEALEDNKEYGFAGDFRYLAVEGNASDTIYFLDYSFERNSELNFMWVSLLVFLLAVILVLILVRFFLKPVMKPIREAYSKQRQFITDASHELKTPLTVISTNIQLIEMEEGGSQWTQSISNQVSRLETLSNDLVTLSRMEEADSQLQMSKINLSNIINDVTMGFAPAFKAKEKTVTYDIEEDLEMIGNHDGLENVMSVLMNNALKYSSKKGRVDVSLKKKGKMAQLVVANSASHIEKGSYDHYFERFYRGDKSRNSKTGGFGIGLAVAKSTVEEHGGRIKAVSPDGESFEIRVKLNCL